MAFLDWLIVGGTAMLIKKGLQKAASNRVEEEGEYEKFMAEMKEQETEWDRLHAVNQRRRCMPCSFEDGITYDDFVGIANRAGRKLKRVQVVSVDGAVIRCNVESQTGYSDWDFNVDFNDWGHITGTYWTHSDNSDSSIPRHYGKMVSGWVQDLLIERGIFIRDFSDAVDENKDLETEQGLNYSHKEQLFGKLIKKNKSAVKVECDSEELLGEHIYPVISLLKRFGFKNIKSIPIEDVNDKNSFYIFEVAQVIIAGTGYFEAGNIFEASSEVIITYHEKQKIKMPFSENDMKRKHYINVGDRLQELGFSEIYERKIEDIVTGWMTKDGTVERVLINGDEDMPIKKGKSYEYDEKIVIFYHTFKK